LNPLSPLAFSVGDPDQEVLVRGGQGQGFISFGKPDLGKTQGVFSYLDGESPNRFTFGDAKFAGTAKLPITFSPEFGEPVTLTYIIKIKSTFSPQLIFILGREEVSVLATGGPMKGIITYGEPDLEQTGGEFRFQSPEDSPSTFVFGHPERVGTTVLPVTFTPEIGRPITLNYTIEVVPVTELQFFPAPPFIFTVGDPDIRIKIRGGPLQGTVSYGTVDLGGTQGAFRFESGLEGEEWMIFGGAGKTGEVHLPVTFTPIKGDPLTLVYRIQVIPETLLQFELLPPVTQENKENKENKGKEATGTTPDDEKKE
jgi:hypothetical protein